MRALVTGGSRGIGAATVRRLARAGADVAVHAFRHPEEAEMVAAEARAMGRESWVVRGDLATDEGVRSVVNGVRAKWDHLDVLVHNAGAYDRAMFPAITDAALLATFRLNVFGPFALTRDLLPLVQRSAAGRIVFVSSVLAYTGSSNGAHYASAKAALLGLSKSLAKELAPGSPSTSSPPFPSTPRSSPATPPPNGRSASGPSPPGASGCPRRWRRRLPSSHPLRRRTSPEPPCT